MAVSWVYTTGGLRFFTISSDAREDIVPRRYDVALTCTFITASIDPHGPDPIAACAIGVHAQPPAAQSMR
jgi:hypothetical protein